MHEIQHLINKKEILTKEDLIKMASIIAKYKNVLLSDIKFSNKGPQMICGKNELTLCNNIEAAWFKQDIYEFKNGIGLNYIENENLKKNLNIIYEELTTPFINSLLALITFHEIRHAEQFKIIDETYMYNDPVLLKNLMLSYFNTTPLFVSLYHDKVYYEYEATISAIMDLLKYEIDPKIKRFIAYKILLAYTNKPGKEILSPLENNKNSNGDKLESNYYKKQIEYINNNIYLPKEDIRLGTRHKKIKEIDRYYQGIK